MMSDRNSIIHLPNNHLRQKSKDLSFPLSAEAKKIIENMKAATIDWEKSREHEVGVALAAVQIDELLRIVIIRKDFENKANKEFDIYINPEITRYDGVPKEDFEGCLSIKDVYGKVARYPRVKIKARDENGQPIKQVVKGFLARVFQHEIDHTNGMTYADRIGKEGTFFLIQPDGSMKSLDSKEHDELVNKLELA